MGAFDYILNIELCSLREFPLERDEFPFVGHGFGLILQSTARGISWLSIWGYSQEKMILSRIFYIDYSVLKAKQ